MHSFGLAVFASLLATAAARPAHKMSKKQTGTVYTGDMTYYTPGLGSCGTTNDESQPVVALALDMMQNPANPNLNPKCGTTITIDFNGAQHTATIVDSCYECAYSDIDLSPTLFAQVDPTGDGRVSGVNWWFDDPSVAPQ